MKKLFLIALISCTSKSNSPNIIFQIRSIDSIAKQIDKKDSLNVYDWSAGINSEDSTIDAIYTYAILMDTLSGIIEKSTIGKLVPLEKHILYFHDNKLIKAKTYDSIENNYPSRELYFENGKILTISPYLNKDSLEKLFNDIADSSTKFANYYQSHIKNKY